MSDRLDGPSSYSPAGERLYTLKFVLTGSSGVGKTQLAARIVRGEFREVSLPTVGMEFATRPLRYAEHSSVRAQIWDTAGKFSFKSVTETFFRGAVGAMLVYDISRRSTFDDVVRWLALVRDNCHESIALILVGNKSDMSSKQREVSMMEGMRFARKHGLDFLETSALEDEHVEEASRQLIMSVARYLPQEKCVWSVNKPSYPLPTGWVRVAVSADGKEDEDDPKCFLPPPSYPNALMPPPPPQPPTATAANSASTRVNAATTATAAIPSAVAVTVPNTPRGSVLWFENTWTGERVSQRPLYPAGPSEACVVSQVPRPLDPLTFLADPVKGERRGKGEGEQGWVRTLKMVGKSPSWSFSSLKSKGYAAASECLSKCVDA